MLKGAGRVSGLGDSDGPCRIARYTRRRPGIPPPRLRSAPPFDKGGFPRGLRPRKRLPSQGSWPSLRGLRGFDGLSVATPRFICRGGIHPSRAVRLAAHLRGASGTPPPTMAPGNFPAASNLSSFFSFLSSLKQPAPSESHFGRGWLTDLSTLL